MSHLKFHLTLSLILKFHLTFHLELILLSARRCSRFSLVSMKRSRVLSPPASATPDVVPPRAKTPSRVLVGCAAEASWSGGQADGYTAPVKERRLCKRPVKDKLRERLAKQPKILDKSLRERMSLEIAPPMVVKTGESSSSEEELPQTTRKPKRERALRRHRKYAAFGALEDGSGCSVLERMSVTPAVWSDYKLRVERAIGYMERKQVNLEDDSSLDAGLVTYMTEQFFRGAEAHEGEKLIAGWLAVFPEFNRHGARNLVRAIRALRGWRRVAPSRSRKPLPWPTVAALAVRMIAHNRCDMAVWTLVCFSAYLRPKEAFGMQRRDLIPPRAGITDHWALLIAPQEREDRTKTGDFDDSVLLDTPFLKWVSQALEILKEGPVDSPLWDFDYPELLAMFVRAAKELRIKAVPYQLRHAGPSWDRIRQLRSAEAVRKRGRWRRQASCARYEKHARVAAEHQEYTAAQVVHFDTCAKRLEALLLGGGAPPAVPRL